MYNQNTLKDEELSTHLQVLADINDGLLVPSFAEDCLRRLVRTFGSDEMSKWYEECWVNNSTYHPPNCDTNPKCRGRCQN